MLSSHLLTPEFNPQPIIGHELPVTSIDSYKNLEGSITVKFSMYEPLNPTKIHTLIFTVLPDSPLYLPSTIGNTLIDNYSNNGRHFGKAVFSTVRLHMPEANFLFDTY